MYLLWHLQVQIKFFWKIGTGRKKAPLRTRPERLQIFNWRAGPRRSQHEFFSSLQWFLIFFMAKRMKTEKKNCSVENASKKVFSGLFPISFCFCWNSQFFSLAYRNFFSIQAWNWHELEAYWCTPSLKKLPIVIIWFVFLFFLLPLHARVASNTELIATPNRDSYHCLCVTSLFVHAHALIIPSACASKFPLASSSRGIITKPTYISSVLFVLGLHETCLINNQAN